MSKFYWNEDTLVYFKELKKESEEKLKDEIAKFVWEDCNPEEGETFQDLAQDLLNQVNEL